MFSDGKMNPMYRAQLHLMSCTERRQTDSWEKNLTSLLLLLLWADLLAQQWDNDIIWCHLVSSAASCPFSASHHSWSSTDPRFKNIYLATKGLIFFETPHHGGNYINIGLTAQKIVASSGFDASDKVLRDLKFDSSIAKMLSEEFTKFSVKESR